MAKRTYLRRTVVTGEITEHPFLRSDYTAAGVPAAMAAGMPLLEAYQLINKMNISQHEQQYVYAPPLV